MKKNFLFAACALVFTLSFLLVIPVTASHSLQQPLYTPTPDANGRIVYIVQQNDTCLGIALRYLNGDVNHLIQLNNLNEDCFITPNQELLLGYFEAPTTTPGPSPTATSNIPTPTPPAGYGSICVVLYDDINGNARREDNEAAIAGGAISITDRAGITSLTGSTVVDANTDTVDELEPLCFDNLPEDDYNVSVGPPEGYNPTSIMNYPLSLKAGDISILDFGAQISSAAIVQPTGSSSEPGRRSPLLAIVGGVMILSGIGLGIYLRILKR